MGMRNLLLLTGFLALANQCPLEYGPAVFQAQAWIWSIDPMAWFTNPCETGGVNSGKMERISDLQDTSSELMMVYPNPAMDQIHVLSNASEAYHLRVFNSLGSVVLEMDCEGGKEIVLQVSNYPKGAYLLQVESAAGIISKIVVFE